MGAFLTRESDSKKPNPLRLPNRPLHPRPICGNDNSSYDTDGADIDACPMTIDVSSSWRYNHQDSGVGLDLSLLDRIDDILTLGPCLSPTSIARLPVVATTTTTTTAVLTNPASASIKESPQPASRLLALPPELLLQIASYLLKSNDVPSLVALKQTCRFFFRSPEYTGPNPVPLPNRLAYILDYQKEILKQLPDKRFNLLLYGDMEESAEFPRACVSCVRLRHPLYFSRAMRKGPAKKRTCLACQGRRWNEAQAARWIKEKERMRKEIRSIREEERKYVALLRDLPDLDEWM